MLQIAITETFRLCSGRVKGHNYSCRNYEGVWKTAVEIHTFLTSPLAGTK